MGSEGKKGNCRSRAFHGADEWWRKAGKYRRPSQLDGEFRKDGRELTGRIESVYMFKWSGGRLYAAQRAITLRTGG